MQCVEVFRAFYVTGSYHVWATLFLYSHFCRWGSCGQSHTLLNDKASVNWNPGLEIPSQLPASHVHSFGGWGVYWGTELKGTRGETALGSALAGRPWWGKAAQHLRSPGNPPRRLDTPRTCHPSWKWNNLSWLFLNCKRTRQTRRDKESRKKLMKWNFMWDQAE